GEAICVFRPRKLATQPVDLALLVERFSCRIAIDLAAPALAGAPCLLERLSPRSTEAEHLRAMHHTATGEGHERRLLLAPPSQRSPPGRSEPPSAAARLTKRS